MNVDEATQKMDALQIHVPGTSLLAKEPEAEVKMPATDNVIGTGIGVGIICHPAVTDISGNIKLREKSDDILQVENSHSGNSMKEYVKPHLKQILTTQKERTFEIKSNDLFLPKLKQFGDSLHETKEHFVKSDGVSVIPSAFRPQLTRKLSVALEKNNWFLDYDLISRKNFKFGNQTKPIGLVFLTTTMLVPFCIQSDHYCKDDTEADVIIFLPNQPVLVLTISKDEQTQSKNVSLYNASITRGIVMHMGRFMNEGFKIAFGVISPKVLENPDVFRSCLEKFVTSSPKYVTFRSMAMDPVKYEKVVTAFWACMTETKCVDDEEECIRFLTKDQSVVLVEHISRGGVEVLSSGGSGTSVLLAEVSRRLSHYGKTMFLVEKKEDWEKYRKLIPCVTTSTDLTDLKVEDFKCIVEETANPEISAVFHWKRHRIDEQSKLEEQQQNSQKKQRLSVEEPSTASAGIPNTEVLSVPSTFLFGRVEPREITIDINDKKIRLPLLDMDKALLNTNRCQIRENNVMENIPLGRKPGTYTKLWGTSARLPAGEQEIFYWEVHNKVLPKNPDSDLANDSSLKHRWEPLIEFGLVKTSCVDKTVFRFQTDGSVCLLLRGCEEHQKFCLQKVIDKEATCTDEDVKIANNATFDYGILYDRSRGIIAFRNVKTGVHLGSVSYVTDEELLPVFALTYTKSVTVLVNLKLVCGSNIDVTDDLQNFFEKVVAEKIQE